MKIQVHGELPLLSTERVKLWNHSVINLTISVLRIDRTLLTHQQPSSHPNCKVLQYNSMPRGASPGAWSSFARMIGLERIGETGPWFPVANSLTDFWIVSSWDNRARSVYDSC